MGTVTLASWVRVTAIIGAIVTAASCGGTPNRSAGPSAGRPAGPEAPRPPEGSSITHGAVAPGTEFSSLPVLTDANLAGIPPSLGSWVLTGRTEVAGPYADQGVATVDRPGGRTEIVYTGTLTVTRELQAHGWTHVGDPDGWNGWLVEPFQGGPGTTAKMFRVTSPDGTVTQRMHPLAPGEAPNNSFAAVSPDGMWIVSGEWGTERRLLVLPMPGVNPAAPALGPLPLSGTVTLNEPVANLQGCAFSTATRLLCTDAAQVLELDLDRPVGGLGQQLARVRPLGPVPMYSDCQGTYEPEGLDVERVRRELRIEVAPPRPCNVLMQVYEYRLSVGG